MASFSFSRALLVLKRSTSSMPRAAAEVTGKQVVIYWQGAESHAPRAAASMIAPFRQAVPAPIKRVANAAPSRLHYAESHSAAALPSVAAPTVQQYWQGAESHAATGRMAAARVVSHLPVRSHRVHSVHFSESHACGTKLP